MFRFGFLKDDDTEDKDVDNNISNLKWLNASKIEVPPSYFGRKFKRSEYTENKSFPGFTLKLLRSEDVLNKLIETNCKNIVEAELQHSDLIPAKYEGGLKIWECTYDLGVYIIRENIELENKLVLDLGCGAGIIGLISLLRGATVHFQDYNAEVIRAVTIPNVLVNFEDRQTIRNRCEFYCGDWASYTDLSLKEGEHENKKFDLIFTSETIYNPDNQRKLYEVFKKRLKEDGTGYVAAKTYYFGVGGGMRQFENLVKEDGMFETDTLWKSQKGLQREILRLRRC